MADRGGARLGAAAGPGGTADGGAAPRRPAPPRDAAAELVALGARSVGPAVTAPIYRLVALPGPGVPRGGIVAVGAGGHAIEVELHEVPTAALGDLLMTLPAPLALGRVRLHDGSRDHEALGMVCTSAPADAVDVSAWGSWPAYLAAAGPGA